MKINNENNNSTSTHLKELTNVEKENLLTLILQSDLRQLRTFPLSSYNLNFLYPASPLNIKFDKQITPLLLSCYIGKIDIFILLLTNEYIDINLPSQPEKYTPIMISCFKGFYEITRMLLEKNASLTFENQNGQLPFIFCFSRLEQSSYRYENKKICMMLVDLLLSYGADINSRFDNIKGYTILIKLVSGEIKNIDKLNTVKEMAKFLLERGADPTLRGKDEKSIIDIVKNSSAILTHYKEELIEVLSNTKQLYFFNDENFIKRGDKIGKGHMRSLTGVPFLNKTIGNEVVFETNEDNMNCCLLI